MLKCTSQLMQSCLLECRCLNKTSNFLIVWLVHLLANNLHLVVR